MSTAKPANGTASALGADLTPPESTRSDKTGRPRLPGRAYGGVAATCGPILGRGRQISGSYVGVATVLQMDHVLTQAEPIVVRQVFDLARVG